ncbi:hypothetical protein SK128_004801 [Halocaridina rubra]|uniref:Apple domain-containing protein n=1 Tax=Halocaridina rubra TaxID=373956 RepID=A0AAN8WXN0_HALRR
MSEQARGHMAVKVLFLLLAIALHGPSLCEAACQPVEIPGEGDYAVPNYAKYFDKPFTLLLEMTEINKNKTEYVKQSYYKALRQDVMMETSSVSITNNGTFVVYHYFPQTGKYIEEYNDACIEPGGLPGWLPYGWYDEKHPPTSYGPATILRNVIYEKTRYEENHHIVNNMKCERWYACIGGTVEVHLYFSARSEFNMPEQSMFDEDPVIADRIPVMFEVLPEDPDKHIRYSVVEFVPYLHMHSNIETPRGLACEDKVSIAPGMTPPNIPKHFSMEEELVQNSMIDGILYGTKQHLDKAQVTYSEDLSMTKVEFVPSRAGEEQPVISDRIIHDFNTGVQYVIDKVLGNCSIDFIPPYSFDVDHAGVIGGYGSMSTPNGLFHLDDTYAYVGDRTTRGLRGDLFTSTRKDIPDPSTGFVNNFPKAVLEYYFSQGLETSPSGLIPVQMPTRGDFFLYNKSNEQQMIFTMTTNFYNFKEIGMFSTDEFSVMECYDRYHEDWSTLYIFFPATEDHFGAVSVKPDEFQNSVFMQILVLGDVSPARIGQIDVSNGISGWYANTTNSDTIIVSVKFMERISYIYGYKVPETVNEKPGKDEFRIDNYDLDGCAESCTLKTDPPCKSFHLCGGDTCFLSDNEGPQGEQNLNVSRCLHWVSSHENTTFTDLPTAEVDERLRNATVHGDFAFIIKYKNRDIKFNASFSMMVKTPDPHDPVLMQFSLFAKRKTIADPDFRVKGAGSWADCLTVCVSWREFRCETAVHYSDSGDCLLYTQHTNEINETRFHQRAFSYVHSSKSYCWFTFQIAKPFSPVRESSYMRMACSSINLENFTRYYVTDYKMMLGGLSISTPGLTVPGYSPELCAWECSNSNEDFDCNSFEFCWYESMCHLHKEKFMDVSNGGNYTIGQPCVHFEKKDDQLFTRYPSQGMPNNKHKLVSQISSIQSCAQQCLEATSETCQSYDFCLVCHDEDVEVCGNNKEGFNMCFLSNHHIGEPDLTLGKAVNCDHYSRDSFDGVDYPSWIGSQRKTSKPYTGGSMAGLAFGMIFLGIALALAVLFIISKVRPSSVPNELTLSSMKFSSEGQGESET